MTPAAAVAAGDRAVADLQTTLSSAIDRGEASLVLHRSIAVAWSTRCRWVETHDDGDVLVVLDGRLHGRGGPAPAVSDLAARFRAHGAGLAADLAGDFVIIVLERSTRTLLVARDPLGVRPWYQASRSPSVAGSTDVATLTSLPWVDREVDEQVAIAHLAAVTACRGTTFHRGITTLAPGATWIHHDGGARTVRHHEWDLAPDLETSWEEAAERCRQELDRAVARRLAASGPATAELSGGLDSSAVVGTAMGLGCRDLLVGRLVFDGPRADERQWSDAVVDHWQIPVVSSPPWIPDPDEEAALTRDLTRPLPDPQFLMFAGLRRALLAEGRPDALTGLGGDDAFVGSGMGSVMVSAVQLRQWPVLVRAARATVRRPRDAWRFLHKPTLHHLARWRAPRLPPWVSPAAATRADLASWFGSRPPKVTGIAAIDERIANISEGYDGAILQEQAVVSDLVGARATHPFLDPRLIEATYGLDPAWPGRDDHTRALQVAAYRDRLPHAVATRRTKADFAEVFWPRVRGEEARAEVRRGPLVERGWLDLAGYDDLLDRAASGAPDAAIPLARCLSLHRWLRAH